MKNIDRFIILGILVALIINIYVININKCNCTENCKNQIPCKCDTTLFDKQIEYQKIELDRIRNAPISEPYPDDIFFPVVESDTTIWGNWLLIYTLNGDLVFRKYYEDLWIDIVSNSQPINWASEPEYPGILLIDPKDPVTNILPLTFTSSSGKQSIHIVFRYKNGNWIANSAIFTNAGNKAIGGKISVTLEDFDFRDIMDKLEETGVKKRYINGHFY